MPHTVETAYPPAQSFGNSFPDFEDVDDHVQSQQAIVPTHDNTIMAPLTRFDKNTDEQFYRGSALLAAAAPECPVVPANRISVPHAKLIGQKGPRKGPRAPATTSISPPEPTRKTSNRKSSTPDQTTTTASVGRTGSGSRKPSAATISTPEGVYTNTNDYQKARTTIDSGLSDKTLSVWKKVLQDDPEYVNHVISSGTVPSSNDKALARLSRNPLLSAETDPINPLISLVPKSSGYSNAERIKMEYNIRRSVALDMKKVDHNPSQKGAQNAPSSEDSPVPSSLRMEKQAASSPSTKPGSSTLLSMLNVPVTNAPNSHVVTPSSLGSSSIITPGSCGSPYLSPMEKTSSPGKLSPALKQSQNVSPLMKGMYKLPLPNREVKVENNDVSRTMRDLPDEPPEVPQKEDRTIIRTRDSNSHRFSMSMLCRGCMKPVHDPSKAFKIQALNSVFHTKCFRCSICRISFSDQNPYIAYKGRAYCRTDYKAVLQNFCNTCNKLVQPNVGVIVDGRVYHRDHIPEIGGGNPFVKVSTEESTKRNSQVVKPTTANATGPKSILKRNAPTCKKCCLPINNKPIHALDNDYHDSCFSCLLCDTDLRKQVFYSVNEFPVCLYDYHVLNNSICKSCKKPVEGVCAEVANTEDCSMELDIVKKTKYALQPGDAAAICVANVNVSRYHPECWKCSTCGLILDKIYFMYEGQPYCERDIYTAAASEALSEQQVVEASQDSNNVISISNTRPDDPTAEQPTEEVFNLSTVYGNYALPTKKEDEELAPVDEACHDVVDDNKPVENQGCNVPHLRVLIGGMPAAQKPENGEKDSIKNTRLEEIVPTKHQSPFAVGSLMNIADVSNVSADVFSPYNTTFECTTLDSVMPMAHVLVEDENSKSMISTSVSLPSPFQNEPDPDETMDLDFIQQSYTILSHKMSKEKEGNNNK